VAARVKYSEPLVVVIGGAGYIGSILVRHLLSHSYAVRVFDNFLFGRDGIVGLTNPNLEIIEGDITDTRAVSNAINGADTVILLAGIVGSRVAEVQWSGIREINFLASSVVLDAAIEHGVTRFIFASTDSVYGCVSGVLYETALPEPVSIYSRLKLRMEERVMNAKKRTFHPTALRIATCYGYSPRMRFDLVINGIVRDAVLKKVIEIKSEEQTRAFVHVDDAASAILSCVKAHVNLVSGEVFNLGASGQSYTLNQLANMVKTIVPDVEVNVLEEEPDLVNYQLSCSKIEKILDFQPKWTVEKSMERIRNVLLDGPFEDPYSPKYQNT
jgi:nucleoside-diphosphate-sugar epimerase